MKKVFSIPFCNSTTIFCRANETVATQLWATRKYKNFSDFQSTTKGRQYHQLQNQLLPPLYNYQQQQRQKVMVTAITLLFPCCYRHRKAIFLDVYGDTTRQTRNAAPSDKFLANPKLNMSEGKTLKLENADSGIPLSTFFYRLQNIFLKSSPVSAKFLRNFQSAKLQHFWLRILAIFQQLNSPWVPLQLHKQNQQVLFVLHDDNNDNNDDDDGDDDNYERKRREPLVFLLTCKKLQRATPASQS